MVKKNNDINIKVVVNIPYYSQLENQEIRLNYLASYLLQNDNICRILKYNSKDCLSLPISDSDREILIQSDINGIENLERKIFFQPFLNKVIKTEKTELRIYPSSFYSENNVLTTIYITIDLIVNNKIWEINDSRIRPLVLISEIYKALNGADILGIGLLNTIKERNQLLVFSDYFSGYRLNFKNSSN